MSDYVVNTDLQKEEWQLKNQARGHVFFCDSIHDDGTDAGPNPVEYLTGAVNSCVAMSAGMVAKSHQLDISNFKVHTQSTTTDLGHGKSLVTAMKMVISFSSTMNVDEKKQFVDHVLHVSTVFQTVKQSIDIKVEIAN